MSVRQDNTELRVGRNGVALPRDVLTEEAPLGGRQDRESRAFRRRRPPRIDWGREILRIVIGLLGSFLALVLIIASLGLAYGSLKMGGVLRDIAKRDFGEATQRFERYGAHFATMRDAGMRILTSEPKIVSGVTKYLWVVQPRGSDDRIVYRWKHELKTSTVEPMTNAALLMDIALGYISPSDASAYSFYDPNDKLAMALAQDDPALYSPYQGQQRIAGLPVLQPGPVGAPLVDPEKARGRLRGNAPPKDETAEEGEVDPNAPVEGESQPGDSTDVGDAQPGDGEEAGPGDGEDGDGDDGDSSEVNPGDGEDGEGEEEPAPEPPDSDAVPVE